MIAPRLQQHQGSPRTRKGIQRIDVNHLSEPVPHRGLIFTLMCLQNPAAQAVLFNAVDSLTLRHSENLSNPDVS
jgi:hypothetical protein